VVLQSERPQLVEELLLSSSERPIGAEPAAEEKYPAVAAMPLRVAPI
jgi:hypothetical protein